MTHLLAGNLLGKRVSGAGVLGASRLPFTDTFTRGDGDLDGGWQYTAGKWTIATNAAVGTPGLGTDLIVNGGFGADSNWTKGTGWSIGAGVATHAPGSAAYLEAAVAPLTANKWYQNSFDIPAISANSFLPLFGNSATFSYGTTGTKVTTDYAVTNGSAGFLANALTNGSVDNVIYQLITTVDMFATRHFGRSSIDVSVPLTISGYKATGIVLCLDSITSPGNYILAICDGLNARLIKCVGGVNTSLISASITYVAGRILRAVKSGTSASLYYNGVQIGTTQTVSDAGIVNNTRHGMFSTSPLASIASFTAVAA